MAMSVAPFACLSPFAGSTLSVRRRSLLNVSTIPARSCSPLRSSFLGFLLTPTPLSSPSSSFSGLSLGVDKMLKENKRWSLIVCAGRAALGLTKRWRSRKSLARTHGFRRRMRTTSGRAVLKRRRAKGRKVLCTKTNPNSGKRASR